MRSIYKSLLLIFPLVVVITQSAIAQKNLLDPARISAGIKGGYTSSSVGFYPAVNRSAETAPTFGIVMKYNSEKYFGAQFEVNYATIGYKEFNKEDITEEVYERQFNYVQIPLLTHIYIGKRKFQFFITVGPEIDILVGEKKTILSDINNQAYDYYDKPANPVAVSLAGGAGINIITGIGHFQLEGRFSASMTNILKEPDRSSTDRSNSTFGGVNFSYLIPIQGWKEKPKKSSLIDGLIPSKEENKSSNWENRD
ncbi:PorT family protein [Flammeovirga pectinis]|uniref:PorT family protein n=1 Tax=Flammeovirga pectinis TaxID=2494373 RepID=A0A3S9P4S7_9BACT|nr:porin family protein [Flammeovirga pectinis]AZQ63220.1 PorT family protein [Flammeovirga pectinis]